MEDLTVNSEIDTKGTKCPMPMLKTKKALAKMLSGEVLRILATDPHAEIDLKQ
ncbi:sulfurtransferase TusA family protein, partial [Turicimonas muris]